MNQIVDFVQVRADGKLVPSTLTVRDMLALGWEPSKMVALRWNHGNREVEIEASDGVHGIVVPGANFVAALVGGDETNASGRLVIISPDGSTHGEIGSPASISGRDVRGAFGWFEPAMTPRMNTFGAVFQTDEQAAFRCDIDATEPALISAIKVQ